MANEEQLKILKQGVAVWNKWREENGDETIDLGGADLSGTDLSRVNLSMTILSKANLSRAVLNKAVLTGADLEEANLGGADLSEANLSKAVFTGAFLRVANLSKAVFTEAFLIGADLSEANLSKAVFTGAFLKVANLSGADLEEANLIGADLSGTDLSEVDFRGADLRGTVLRGADLHYAVFSRAVVNEDTINDAYGTKGVQIGVNGIWCEATDSAALMTLTPPGNSMQGHNPDAVIESLKRSRRLHGFSLALIGIVILFYILRLSEIEIPNLRVKITSDRFGLLAMPLAICLLSLVATFMSDALKGARYLQDRKSAMTVGNFPWVLSKYAGKGWVNKIQSFVSRGVMSFHPIIYGYYLRIWLGNRNVTNIVFFGICIILLLILSGRIFLISHNFQRPILFDRKTEEERQDDLTNIAKAVERQTKAVEAQTEAITGLTNELKTAQDEQSSQSARSGGKREDKEKPEGDDAG